MTTKEERKLVKLVLDGMDALQRSIGSADRVERSSVEITRKSELGYDLAVKGRMGGHGFSSWLVLGAIYALVKWWEPEVAILTDHPTMARDGDWSGVRDTGEEQLWVIFDRFVLGQTKVKLALLEE